jgi:hypothetical protein
VRRAGKRGALSLVLFSQELLALLNAGLGIVEGLEALLEKEANPPRAACWNACWPACAKASAFPPCWPAAGPVSAAVCRHRQGGRGHRPAARWRATSITSSASTWCAPSWCRLPSIPASCCWSAAASACS